MVKSLRQVHSRVANPLEFEAGALSEPTLQSSDQYYEIFAAQGDTTTAYGAGFGPRDKNTNSDGWSDLDLQNAGGTAIAGKIRFRVYRDSSKEDLIAQSGTYSLNSLRSAVSEARTDKVLIAGLLSTMAGNDSFLTVEVKPSASSAGDAVSAANSNSDQGLAYSELPR